MALIDDIITFEGPDKGLFLKPVLTIPTIESLGWQKYFGQTEEYAYFNSSINKVTKAKTGCGHTAGGANLSITRKKWAPKRLEAYDEVCAADFDQTIFAAMRKAGISADDITGTQLETILKGLWLEAVADDYLRIILLADTGLSDANYSMLDGWYKKLSAQITGPTYGAQDLGAIVDGDIDSGSIIGTLNEFRAAQPRRMKSQPDNTKALYVTRTVFEAYQEKLLDNETLESARLALISGKAATTFRGIELIPLDTVDNFLIDVDSTSGVVDTPHRIVLARKDQTSIMLDSDNAGKEAEIWYDRDEDVNRMLSNYRADVQLGYEEFFVIGGF